MSNDHFALTALSPLDGRYRSKVVEVAALFSEFSLIKHRVQVEIEYLLFLSREGFVPKISVSDVKKLKKIYVHFNTADAQAVKKWEVKTNHDVKAVEYFLRDQLSAMKSPLASKVHLGLTSEDTNTLSYSLMLRTAQQTVVVPRLQSILKEISELARTTAKAPLLARTHGQVAVPTTFGKELVNVAMRLLEELRLLEALPIEAKLNGAVGNFNAHTVALPTKKSWQQLSQRFISSLGLKPQPFTTQILPAESYSRFFSSVLRINVNLLDLNQDLWRYISDGYLVQHKVKAEVGSSTMPHKVNPIDFENSEGNLGLANALLQHFMVKLPISRLQRDLSDSTVKRSMGTALGYGDLAYQSLVTGLKKVSFNEVKAREDLNQHWEVLSEAIQVALRAEGDAEGYEKLQKLTQGKVVTQEMVREFIDASNLRAATKTTLKKLTPETYIGLAPVLTQQGLKTIQIYLQGAT